jgi:hypothetical protein
MTQPCISTNKTQAFAEYIIDNVNRSHAGKYTCEVKNWLNTSLENRYEATSYVSTDVRIQCKFYLTTPAVLAPLSLVFRGPRFFRPGLGLGVGSRP